MSFGEGWKSICSSVVGGVVQHRPVGTIMWVVLDEGCWLGYDLGGPGSLRKPNNSGFVYKYNMWGFRKWTVFLLSCIIFSKAEITLPSCNCNQSLQQ